MDLPSNARPAAMSDETFTVPPPVDQEGYHQIVSAAGHRILAAAIEQGPLFAPHTFQVGGGQLFVAIHVGINCTRGRQPREWTPCERDIFAILETATQRLTAPRILDEFERRGILHGESTLTHALAILVKEGVLASSKKAPRGYYIPVEPQSQGTSHVA